MMRKRRKRGGGAIEEVWKENRKGRRELEEPHTKKLVLF